MTFFIAVPRASASNLLRHPNTKHTGVAAFTSSHLLAARLQHVVGRKAATHHSTLVCNRPDRS